MSPHGVLAPSGANTVPCQPRHPLLQEWHASPPCPGHTVSSLNIKSYIMCSDSGASVPGGGEGGSLHPSQSVLHCFAGQRGVRNRNGSTSKQASRVNTTAPVSGGQRMGQRHLPSSLSEAAGCPWGHGPQGCLSASPEVLGWDIPLWLVTSCRTRLVHARTGDPPGRWTPCSFPLGSCSGIRQTRSDRA